MSTWLVISDLDGTLLGNDPALDRFARWHQSVGERVLLAYASGRSCTSVAESIRETALPAPAAIIGNVGTEICRFPGGQTVGRWPKMQPGSWSADRVRAALAGMDGLELQPAHFQSPHKVSFFLRAAHRIDDVRQRLERANLSAEIVYSSQRDLDILPRGANKGSAARYLAYALHVADDRVIVCGDSGNDAAMFQSGWRGVIVENALPELKRLSGQLVYQARGAFADGVLEGVQHWMQA
jgi:sucrose-6F-phosphate phosphohydrolase